MGFRRRTHLATKSTSDVASPLRSILLPRLATKSKSMLSPVAVTKSILYTGDKIDNNGVLRSRVTEKGLAHLTVRQLTDESNIERATRPKHSLYSLSILSRHLLLEWTRRLTEQSFPRAVILYNSTAKPANTYCTILIVSYGKFGNRTNNWLSRHLKHHMICNTELGPWSTLEDFIDGESLGPPVGKWERTNALPSHLTAIPWFHTNCSVNFTTDYRWMESAAATQSSHRQPSTKGTLLVPYLSILGRHLTLSTTISWLLNWRGLTHQTVCYSGFNRTYPTVVNTLKQIVVSPPGGR